MQAEQARAEQARAEQVRAAQAANAARAAAEQARAEQAANAERAAAEQARAKQAADTERVAAEQARAEAERLAEAQATSLRRAQDKLEAEANELAEAKCAVAAKAAALEHREASLEDRERTAEAEREGAARELAEAKRQLEASERALQDAKALQATVVDEPEAVLGDALLERFDDFIEQEESWLEQRFTLCAGWVRLCRAQNDPDLVLLASKLSQAYGLKGELSGRRGASLDGARSRSAALREMLPAAAEDAAEAVRTLEKRWLALGAAADDAVEQLAGRKGARLRYVSSKYPLPGSRGGGGGQRRFRVLAFEEPAGADVDLVQLMMERLDSRTTALFDGLDRALTLEALDRVSSNEPLPVKFVPIVAHHDV